MRWFMAPSSLNRGKPTVRGSLARGCWPASRLVRPAPAAREGRTAMPVLRSRGTGGRAARAAPVLALAAACASRRDGHVAVDLAAALAAQPGRPTAIATHGDDDRRHQPQQDLHAHEGRDAATGDVTCQARLSGVPTHSSVPSPKRWCFQIGTSALSVSIRAREAANASPRWAAVVRDDHRDVADREACRPGAPRRRRGRRTPRRPARRPRRIRPAAVGWAE